jgi:hypothetical protein
MAQTKRRKKAVKPLTEEDIYIDPVDEWIADHSEEWSRKYPGKYLGIVNFQVVAIDDDPGRAYDKTLELHPEESPTVLYMPLKEELEMLL